MGRMRADVIAGHSRPSSRAAEAGPGQGWGSALLKSLLVLALSAAGFVIVPHLLYVKAIPSLNLTPGGGDALVLLWVLGFFVFLTWLVVWLQPRGKRA